MGVQTSDCIVGIAKQSARGTAATNPTYAHGVESGGLKLNINQDRDKLTGAARGGGVVFRDKVENGAAWATRAYIASIGTYLMCALGSVTTTGTTPKTHVFTPTAGELPFFTAFQDLAGQAMKVADCKINEIKLSWEENKPLILTIEGPGCVWTGGLTLTPTTVETDTDDYLRPVGGTFKYAVSGAAAVAAVTKGSITIRNKAAAKFKSGQLAAYDVEEGAFETEVNLTTVPDDLADWLTYATGTSNGTTIANTPVVGAFEVTFVDGAASLKLADDATYFMCDLPEGEPDGGHAEIELSGLGTDITATLINTVASY